MKYTERVDGFQIADVSWLVPPENSHPLRFDVIKWYEHKPEEQTNLYTGEKRTVTENCYSVGTIGYNRKEHYFEFKSVGMRWIAAHPTKKAENMVIDFVERMQNWINDNVDEDNGGVVNYGLLPWIHREFSGSPGRDKPDDTDW